LLDLRFEFEMTWKDLNIQYRLPPSEQPAS